MSAEEAKEQIQKILKHINFEKGTYENKGLSLKIRDLTVTEMEQLQDKEAAKSDLDLSKMKAADVLKVARDWQNFVINIAFENEQDIEKLRETLSASEYIECIEEVFVFLGRFMGPKGAREFMNISTE
jgi:hypothetical protein